VRKFIKEDTVGRIVFIGAVIIVCVLTISAGSLVVVSKVLRLHKDMAHLEESFIVDQKNQLKRDVESLVENINFQQSQLKKQLERNLAQQVKEARMIATNIYLSTLGEKEEKVLGLIREAVRPLRIHDEQGYCFIFDFQGNALLYPADSSLEGSSFYTNPLGGGGEVVEEIINLALRQGQGFLYYDWYKPFETDGKRYPKISYVSRFDPLNLIFGTGEYLDNLDRVTKQTIVRSLRSNWQALEEDYYFVYDIHNMAGGDEFATMLLNSNRPDMVGKKISDAVLDSHGTAFRKQFMDGVRDNGEAYVIYWYKKPDGSGEGRKLSYFKYYPQWNWVLAKGIYFDRFDATLTKMQSDLQSRLQQDIALLGLIFVVGIILSLVLAYWFAQQLQDIFDSYRYVQQRHMKNLEHLNVTLKTQSETDALTQIANRGHFNRQLAHILSGAIEQPRNIALIMFDIDHFKVINDTYGHLAGDTVLQELSKLVASNIRHIDLFARFGGEEFILLILDTEKDAVWALAEKLRKTIEEHSFTIQTSVTCSFGIACHAEKEKFDDFIYRVDKALYQAKSGGRNMCVLAEGVGC
jgi:diguanylate cyclase (GGDEF)-like protein